MHNTYQTTLFNPHVEIGVLPCLIKSDEESLTNEEQSKHMHLVLAFGVEVLINAVDYHITIAIIRWNTESGNKCINNCL